MSERNQLHQLVQDADTFQRDTREYAEHTSSFHHGNDPNVSDVFVCAAGRFRENQPTRRTPVSVERLTADTVSVSSVNVKKKI